MCLYAFGVEGVGAHLPRRRRLRGLSFCTPVALSALVSICNRLDIPLTFLYACGVSALVSRGSSRCTAATSCFCTPFALSALVSLSTFVGGELR